MKIYWFVQQLNRIGGTEMVSIELMKQLAQEFEITLVSVSEIKDEIVYDLGGLPIKSLGVPQEVCRYDEFLSYDLKNHHYLKALTLSLNLIKEFIFKRHHYRQMISSVTNVNDLIIASSMDSYIYAPLDRRCVFHYHFNAKTYFSLSNRLMSLLARKSDYTVFLTKDTYQHVIEKLKQDTQRFTYIYNPSRFKRTYIEAHFQPRFVFMGRLEKQKNPMCLLKVMNELKKHQIAFHLDILGNGSYFQEMQTYINTHHLESNITMHGQVSNIEDYLKNNDFNILTSTYEGFPLSIIEASSFGLYNISTNWGDAVYEAIDGNNGIVIDSFDEKIIAEEIIKVLKQDLNQLKYNSYQDAKRFDFDTVKQDWINLFNRIAEEN